MLKAQWQWIISGVVILIAGIFVLVNPTLVVKIAVLSFGVYTLIEGIYSLILSWAVRKAHPHLYGHRHPGHLGCGERERGAGRELGRLPDRHLAAAERTVGAHRAFRAAPHGL